LSNEGRTSQVEQDEVRENPGRERERKDALKVLAGTISCVVGILLGVGGILLALLGASTDISAGAVGAGLGVLGYSLGARRLGKATVILGVGVIFFMTAVNAGLIPSVALLGHGYGG
jgi:hypothetical protein